MSRECLLQWLSADRDGELRGWRRWWLRRALARSPELRAEARALERLGAAIREAEVAATPAPALWDAIEGALDGIDRERALPAAREPGGRAWAAWWPAGAALAAAAAAGAVFLFTRPPTAPLAAESAVGHVRSLDTGGRAVWVQEGEGATIIWLVGNGVDPV